MSGGADPGQSKPGIRAFEHNYQTKGRREVPVEEVSITDVGDRIFWIDIPDPGLLDNVAMPGVGKSEIASLRSDPDAPVSRVADNVFRFDMVHVPYEDWARTKDFSTRRIKCLLGARFLITCHDGESPLIDRLLSGYVTDFQTTSRGGIFLIYEMFHHVLNAYLKIHHGLQLGLRDVDEQIATADESIIRSALALHHKLLEFREIAHSSRNVLNFLASRASLFVSANTRPYLDNMSMVLERLDDDLSVDRQVISDSVNFYVSVVSYKMNTSIKAMTAVNVIFVPLTLLAAIYGMNFISMPEYRWSYGYGFFWILFFIVFVLSVLWLRKRG